ncbi:cholesterol oxidase substrate-binding domain-containing protein [Kitasatospora paracochleata]|uniref:FAD/FMN-containing dehydrogenase n=1 Tax=Kitasatospora paracochleata TaxID=58354 RepID=A0ABT1IWB5_9ACTN|nr:cholesterol oxidase substrate-binding domain-containing protein [Kitasatospora paracochleata]MCP2309440.1 FAD/FMN-containing dehydrogenase [Kitasatospora paracochleata]
MGVGESAGPSRRELLGLSAVLGGAAWLLRGTIGPDSASADQSPPPSLPAGVVPYRRVYQNWSGEVRTDELWTCSPTSPEQVVALADWARANGWRLRAQGYRHTWAPLTVPDRTPAATRVLLVDTGEHLTGMSLTGPSTVRVQTGTTMEDLLAFLAGHGLGVAACPAPGELTVGGVLAIGGHGTGVPGADQVPGHGYGTLSNQVTSLTAVVWDEPGGRYRLRTFDRAEADSAAFLVHLGRAFLTEVEIRVGADRPLRCRSLLDIPADELFAPPGRGGRTLAGFVEESGRAEAIWFPFTDRPWLKVWSTSPRQPFGSHAVQQPYNYPFSDNIPEPVSDLVARLTGGAWELAPLLGQLQYLVARLGLTGDVSDLLLSGSLLGDLLSGDALTHLLGGGLRSDLWGPSRTVLQYVRPSTLRVTASGYAVLARRTDLQWVVSEFCGYYQQLLKEYQGRGEYPVNGPVEIRVTDLDDPAWSGVPGALPPLLSALRPRPDRPDWDTAVWLDVLTFPTTPGRERFSRDIEQFLLRVFDGRRAGLRVEWSKGWAYTADATWADPELLRRTIPDSLRAGGGPGWDEAVAVLDRYDPHRVFGNAFLDGLLRP